MSTGAISSGATSRSDLIGADQTGGAVAIGDVVLEGQTVQFHLRVRSLKANDLHFPGCGSSEAPKSPTRGSPVQLLRDVEKDFRPNPHHDSGVVQERLGPIRRRIFAQGETVGGGRNFPARLPSGVVIFSKPDSRKENQ